MTTEETKTYKVWELKRQINEFRDYMIYRSLSKKIRENDKLSDEYLHLVLKYEELFKLNEDR